MEWYAKYMFRIGENYNIPVIDLSRTMNPFDKSHYGQSPTQPSNKAGQFIVDLIVHSIANFNFESADRFAMVFYGTSYFHVLFLIFIYLFLHDSPTKKSNTKQPKKKEKKKKKKRKQREGDHSAWTTTRTKNNKKLPNTPQ